MSSDITLAALLAGSVIATLKNQADKL